MAEKPLSIDRAALVQALRRPRRPPDAAWCVACGASHGLGPDIPIIVQQEMSKQPSLLSDLISPDYVRDLATKLSGPDVNATWCVACGASHGLGPEARVLPGEASLSDADIEAIADRVFGPAEAG
jgi:hypothetical protein